MILLVSLLFLFGAIHSNLDFLSGQNNPDKKYDDYKAPLIV